MNESVQSDGIQPPDSALRWERTANFILTTRGPGSTLPVVGSAAEHAFLPLPPTAAPTAGGRRIAPDTAATHPHTAGYARCLPLTENIPAGGSRQQTGQTR